MIEQLSFVAYILPGLSLSGQIVCSSSLYKDEIRRLSTTQMLKFHHKAMTLSLTAHAYLLHCKAM